jgi:AcrR family transcriptional regulator
MTATAAGTRRRSARLSRDRLVEAARSLLVAGGTDAIVIREVARTVGVVPSALYKHVDGRDDLLTLLIAVLYDELTEAVVAARDTVRAGHHRARLMAATAGMRTWARAHPAEFDLLFGFPLQGYAAPSDGPTTEASRRFGAAFLAVFGAALADGRLRVRDESSLPGDIAHQLREVSAGPFEGLSPGELYPIVVGFQRMLGLVMIEVTGQLRWALADPEPLTDEQLDRLADELLTPGP